MGPPGVERRLAAILAADVVGYSRLMGTDETGTHARLKSVRKELIEPKIGEHHGRIIKLTGDGALIEFASISDAVECAIGIQRLLAERNARLPENSRIELRIGINLGDVIFDEDDIYGDGVNIAARLESLADPGGICVSDLVRLSVQPRADLAFADLGEQHVKNIARPIRVWRWAPQAASSDPARSPSDETLPEAPSIAVLPFDNMSGDPEQDYFSDGLTEDLITDLSQLSGLSVVARHGVFPYKGRTVGPQQISRELGVRYILEGSIRRAANRVRVNAQLIDARTGFHKWAGRFDRDLENVFALQDEITGAIVSALEVALSQEEREWMARRYTTSIEAYDAFLRGRKHQLRRTEQSLSRAREALEAAIQLDPNFAAAHAVLADNYRQEWTFGWRDDADVLDRALALARRAVEIDETLPLAHTLLGWIHLWRNEHAQAISAAERGVTLGPNNPESWARLGHILDFAGRPREAIPLIERAMRLDPHHPFLYSFFLGHAYQSTQSYTDAIAAYQSAIARNPEFIGAHQMLAAIYGTLGHSADAESEAAATLSLSPDFSIERFVSRLPYKDPAIPTALIDGLRKAGLPD